MPSDVILNKLESLRRCITRVEEKNPDDVTELIDDLDRQDIIVLNIERAVQLCVDIGLQIIGERNLPVPEMYHRHLCLCRSFCQNALSHTKTQSRQACNSSTEI